MKKFNIKVDGVMHEVEVEEVGVVNTNNAVSKVETTAPVAKENTANTTKNVSASDKSVVAPLQGTVQTIKVKIGDSVKAGDVVAIVEAMKMENDIPAHKAGKIVAIHVSTGSKVSAGDAILDIA